MDKKGVVKLQIKWILDDWVFVGFNYFSSLEYQSGIESHRKVLELRYDVFEAVYEEGIYFMLVMHPQPIGMPPRRKMLEKLILQMREKRDVWFAIPLDASEFWLEKEG